MVLHTRVVSGTGGGPEKTILTSPSYLRRLGYDSRCAYMHPRGDQGFQSIRDRAAELAAPLDPLEDRGPIDLGVVRRLLNLCREHRVAIWHGHDYKSNAIGLLVRRFWKMKLVTTVHGWVKFTRRTPLYYSIDRFCLRHYDHVICVSPDLYERCLASRVPQQRCQLIPNAIDTEVYRRRSLPTDAKRRLGLPADRLLIGAVGRLSPEKGFDLLIRAVDRLRRSGQPVHLVIAGEGDQEEPLRALIKELDCGDHVQLLGFWSRMRELYEALDLFALSSLREGLPNVVLEAMAMEVPVLSTRIAGIPQLIEDGANGLLAGPGSVDELAEGLTQFLQSSQLRSSLARAARETIERDYSFLARMQAMTSVYDRLLARTPPRSPQPDIAAPCQ